MYNNIGDSIQYTKLLVILFYLSDNADSYANMATFLVFLVLKTGFFISEQFISKVFKFNWSILALVFIFLSM